MRWLYLLRLIVGTAGERCGVGGGEAGWAGAEVAALAQEVAWGFIFVVPFVMVEGGLCGAD